MTTSRLLSIFSVAMALILWFLLGAMSLSGCAPGYVWYDRNNSPVRQCSLYGGLFVGVAKGSDVLEAPTREAIKHWNTALGRPYFLWAGVLNTHLHAPIPRDVVLVGLEQGWSERRAQAAGGPSNFVSCGAVSANSVLDCYIQTRVFIDPGCTNDPVALISRLRHELGHVLGIDHSPFVTDLMGSRFLLHIKHPVAVNDAEVEAVRDLYHIK